MPRPGWNDHYRLCRVRRHANWDDTRDRLSFYGFYSFIIAHPFQPINRGLQTRQAQRPLSTTSASCPLPEEEDTSIIYIYIMSNGMRRVVRRIVIHTRTTVTSGGSWRINTPVCPHISAPLQIWNSVRHLRQTYTREWATTHCKKSRWMYRRNPPVVSFFFFLFLFYSAGCVSRDQPSTCSTVQ